MSWLTFAACEAVHAKALLPFADIAGFAPTYLITTLLAKGVTMNYTHNALLCSESPGSAAAKAESPESKADFTQALRILGARVLRGYFSYDACEAKSVEVLPTFLSCPLAEWTRVFGRPENTADHTDLATNMHTQTWQQPCQDGTIFCIGNLFDRHPGGSWVILSRVWLS
jgi:hypothetical protein